MNRGFKYGDGFFESIRTIKGHIPLLDQHLLRIKDGISIFEFEIDFEPTPEWLSQIINPEKHPDHVVRISFYREGEGKYAPINNSFATEIETATSNSEFWLPAKLDLFAELQKAPKQAGSIGIYELAKPSHPIFTVKTLSSAFYVLAAKHKVEEKLDYLLLTNSNGEIIEELSSNIICIKGDEMIVPPANSGYVNGTCLRYMMPLYGFQLTKRPILASEIESFDAIYLSQGTTGVKRIK
ncbi:MAG: aminotransferase class IV [Bacteroidia bacterium]